VRKDVRDGAGVVAGAPAAAGATNGSSAPHTPTTNPAPIPQGDGAGTEQAWQEPQGLRTLQKGGGDSR